MTDQRTTPFEDDGLSSIPLPEQPPMDDAAGGPTVDPDDDTVPPPPAGRIEDELGSPS